MNIKVCGITSLKQLQQLDGLEVDFAGLNFYKNAACYAGDKISKSDLQNADLDIKIVGVFVNATFDDIMETVEEYGLDVVQLNGDETPELCEQVSEEVETIKVFRINEGGLQTIDTMIEEYDEICDYYMFDTGGVNGFGRTGIKFDWKKVAESKIEKPFFLSGGIHPDDAMLVKKFKHPDFYSVNLNSRFEKEPGLKDMALILKFIHELKKR